MKIVHMPINELKLDENNPNRMTAKQKSALHESITRYGIVQPLVIGKDNIVINGNQKLQVIQESTDLSKKHAKLPCVMMQELSETERLLLQQALNKISGSHDKEKDLAIFNRLLNKNGNSGAILAKLLGRNESGLLGNVNRMNAIRTTSSTTLAETTTTTTIKTKLGQTYQLGRHTLHVGDCFDWLPARIVKNPPPRINESICIFTDPPYGISYTQGKGHMYGNRLVGKTNVNFAQTDGSLTNDRNDDYDTFITKTCELLYDIAPNVVVYMWVGNLDNQCTSLNKLWQAGFRIQSQIIWDKMRFVLGRIDYQWGHETAWYGKKGKPHWCGNRDLRTVWAVPLDVATDRYIHPTQKPVELARKAVLNSCLRDGAIIDPFAGSGMTLLGAEMAGDDMNVSCVACEIEPVYADTIIDRWQTMTGKKAVLKGKE